MSMGTAGRKCTMQPGGAPCAPALSGADPLHAALAIAGVKLDGVVPEQLALGGLRQVPAQHGLHRLRKPAFPMWVIGGVHEHILAEEVDDRPGELAPLWNLNALKIPPAQDVVARCVLERRARRGRRMT